MRARRRNSDLVIKLPAWTGLSSGARVRVSISTTKQGDPTGEQRAAVEYLKANDAAVASAALGRVLKEYPRLRRENNASIDPEAFDDEVLAFERSIGITSGPRVLPAIRRRSDLRDVMELTSAHVLDIARDGHAYLGFQFTCDWDDEHGAGVLMHRRRVIAFGQADVAFTAWRAIDDGGSPCTLSVEAKKPSKATRRVRG